MAFEIGVNIGGIACVVGFIYGCFFSTNGWSLPNGIAYGLGFGLGGLIIGTIFSAIFMAPFYVIIIVVAIIAIILYLIFKDGDKTNNTEDSTIHNTDYGPW